MQALRLCKLPVKIAFKQTVKNNYNWTFLIFLLFTFVFSLELETSKGLLLQRFNLQIWDVSGQELGALGIRVHSINF